MNISIAWDNDEQTIIRYVFKKGWSWKELHGIFQQSYEMMDTVDHIVSDILDFSDASIFVPSGAISHGKRILNNERHPKLGMTVILGSLFVNNIYGALKRVTKKDPILQWDIGFAKTLPEAYALIAQYQQRND